MIFDLNTGILTVNLVLLAWIKADQINLWKRVNNHTHDVKCDSRECNLVFNGVIIKGE